MSMNKANGRGAQVRAPPLNNLLLRVGKKLKRWGIVAIGIVASEYIPALREMEQPLPQRRLEVAIISNI